MNRKYKLQIHVGDIFSLVSRTGVYTKPQMLAFVPRSILDMIEEIERPNPTATINLYISIDGDVFQIQSLQS